MYGSPLGFFEHLEIYGLPPVFPSSALASKGSTLRVQMENIEQQQQSDLAATEKANPIAKTAIARESCGVDQHPDDDELDQLFGIDPVEFGCHLQTP